VVYFCIGKQKVVWILKLRENGWEAAASALRRDEFNNLFKEFKRVERHKFNHLIYIP
jgi:hypothetical protein